MCVRIVLADGRAVAREGVVSALAATSEIVVAAEAGTTDELVEAVAHTRPDVIVTDISLPGKQAPDGLHLIALLRRRYADRPVVVVTGADHPTLLVQLLRSGCNSIVLNECGVDCLRAAILAAHRRLRYVSPGVRSRMQMLIEQGSERKKPLTAREIDVLRHVARGATVTAIAELTERSVKTVSRQKRTAMQKIGVTGEAELRDYLHEHGLL
ncbi:response regulator [Uliginosibacterium sp. sgz301328]|uniref:response regulator n=1 Tax=Uliginosibacterium sp. sgz301328 TaxID=3243764 RepID=UPI00359E310D